MHSDVIKGFLHLFYEITHILLINKNGLSQETSLRVSRSAFYDV